MSEALATGLASFLSKEWGESVRVSGLTHASAGARRKNVLFEAQRGGERLALAATIVSNPAIQLVPIPEEAARLRFAEEAGVCAPHVHAVCEDASYVGGPFFVSSRVDGVSIPREVLRCVAANEGLGRALGRQCGEALARLHAESIDPEGGDHGFARLQSAPVEAALVGASAMLRTELLQPSPSFALALRWLERARPAEPARVCAVHGDFRNGNLIVDAEGLRAVLDWELGHLGDPAEDLGWLCQRMWRFRNDALEVGGFAGRADLREGYEAGGASFDPERLHWWKVMGTLRWGFGLSQQARAHLEGTVPSIVMAASGRRLAEVEYDLLMLLQAEYA